MLTEFENKKLTRKDDTYYKDCLHEVKTSEKFVGNTNVLKGLKIPEHLKMLKTARLGDQAYCIHGTVVSRNYMRPLIIGKEELDLYNSIQMRRFKEVSRKQ